MSNNNTEYLIDKLIIGGPSELKKEIKDNELVQQYFGKIILKIISTDSINDLTINEVIDNSISEILNINHSLSIMDSLNKNPDFYVFGLENVLEKYLSGSLKCLMITDDLYDKLKHNFNNKKTTIIKCNNSEINTFGGIVGELYFISNID
jgi:peptide subunit release factor 1 (eRF1)